MQGSTLLWLAKQAREEIKRSQHKHFGAELVLKTFNCFKDLLSNLSKFYQESKFRKDKQQALAIVVYLKVAFFQKVRFVFQNTKSPKTIFQKTILTLKFEIPAHNILLLLAGF